MISFFAAFSLASQHITGSIYLVERVRDLLLLSFANQTAGIGIGIAIQFPVGQRGR